MKIFLDDERTTPAGWIRTYTYQETVDMLKTGLITKLSLDHDLGATDTKYTGYDVILWIERQVHEAGFIPPKIYLHTANPVGQENMQRGIEAIERKVNETKN